MSERLRRQAQQERDEMADEIVNNSAGKSVFPQLGLCVCIVCLRVLLPRCHRAKSYLCTQNILGSISNNFQIWFDLFENQNTR